MSPLYHSVSLSVSVLSSLWGAAVYKPGPGQLFKGQGATFTVLTEEVKLGCQRPHTDVQPLPMQCDMIERCCFF